MDQAKDFREFGINLRSEWETVERTHRCGTASRNVIIRCNAPAIGTKKVNKIN